ncbi:glycine-rich protein [Lachnospiraceae bacterium 38-10]
MANYIAPSVKGQGLNIGYTGTVQTIEIVKPGLYKLEAWGGQGFAGAKAGYSVGYKEFRKKEQIIYVCVGGKMNTLRNWQAQGGGATHFALVGGVLQNIGYANRGNILIVAGGSGAGLMGSSRILYGGTGGGTSGGNGTYSTSQHGGASGRGWPGYGGTQTAGGQGCGEMGDYATQYSGSFGKGGDVYNGESLCSGGGGFFGGGSGGDGYYDDGGSSGGGSGWIGGAPTITYKGKQYVSSTQAGIWGLYPVRYGGSDSNSASYYGEPPFYNGKAAISLVKKGTPLMYWGDKEVDEMKWGDVDVDTVFYGNTEVS